MALIHRGMHSVPQRGGEATVPLPPALLQQRGKQVPAFTWCWEAGMCASSWFMKGKSWQFSITPPKNPTQNTLFVHCCSSPAPWILLLHPAFPALRGQQALGGKGALFPDSSWRVPLHFVCNVFTFLPPSPATHYLWLCSTEQVTSVSFLGSSTGQSAPDCCCLHTMLCARASCKMAAPSPRNLGASQCRLSQNVQISRRGGGNSPRNIKTFRWVLMLLNH